MFHDFKVELKTFVESRQSYTRHAAIRDEFYFPDPDEIRPKIWDVPVDRPPKFPPHAIRTRVEYPGTYYQMKLNQN